MIYARLIFSEENNSKVDKDLIVDYIESLLSALLNSGQIVDYFDYQHHIKNKIYYDIIVPEKKSLFSKYDNSYVKEWKKKLTDLNVRISYKVYNSLSESGYKSKNVKELILFAGQSSPLKRFEDFSAVPLYYISFTTEDRTSFGNIKSWEKNYLDCYSLWRRGEINDGFFLNQLSEYNSKLSKQGIKLCTIISAITGSSCYYYLFREKMDFVLEDKCPSCGRNWILDRQLLNMFYYKCDNCNLIS